MKKLPFFKNPQNLPDLVSIGDERTGIIKLLRCYGLKVKEQIQIESLIYKSSELKLDALKIMEKVMNDSGLSIQDAAAFMDNPGTNMAMAFKYREEIAAILDQQIKNKPTYLEVTIILKSRFIDPEILDENAQVKSEFLQDSGEINPKYIGLKDWELEDTETIPQPLFDAITVFIQKERYGWEELIDNEGKNSILENSLLGVKNLSPEESQTGKKSSGKSRKVA